MRRRNEASTLKLRVPPIATEAAFYTVLVLVGLVVLARATNTELWQTAEQIPIFGTLVLRGFRALVWQVVNP